MILRVPVGDSPVQPYGVVGLGAIFWNIDDTTSSNGVTVTTDIDTAFGVKVGGGVDWFVNDHWIVNFNGAYVFNDADGTATASAGGATASVTEKFDLDYWTVGGGLKYLF
jgi:outer membrane protein W